MSGDAASAPPPVTLRSRRVSACLLVVAAAALLYTAHVTVGVGGHRHDTLWNTWFYEAIEISSALMCFWRARRGVERLAWGLIGASLLSFALGDVYFDHVLPTLAKQPYPSWADAGYLAYYPPLYAGLTLLIRRRTAGRLGVSPLEGVVGALAMATVAATFVFTPVVASTHGNVAEVATNLAYPTFDVVLLALVGAGFAFLGARAGRTWALVGLGLLLSAGADSIYLVQAAAGTYTPGGWVNAGWPLSTACLALAAWCRPSVRAASVSTGRRAGLVAHALTALFASLIVGVLGLEAVRKVPIVAHVLLTLAVVALVLRMAAAARERRQLERRTVEAHSDELTGLLNRRGLLERLDRALADGRAVALLLVDLNRFKELNDTLGHNVGDEALCEMARRFRITLPEGGELARLGGDEFVALLSVDAERPPEAAERVARAMHESLEVPVALENLLVTMEASIGIACAPAHARSRPELLRCADVAMYRAKSGGTGTEIYSATSDEHHRDRLTLLSDLRQALDRDELVLHYQPKVSFDGGHSVGVEALVRWEHPRLGLLGPGAFVPLAERDGLIRDLTLHVLDLALAEQRRWRGEGREIAVAVNLSPASLLDARLPDDVAMALARHDAPAEGLELEITETTLMRDPERALDIIARISSLGVAFSLDDFGTGYSSLAQLRRLPVGTLKIDRSFIAEMGENEEDASIVSSTIGLARSLNLMTVAEGVESEAQWEALAGFGCDTAQGYLLGRPMPSDALLAWLEAREGASTV